MYRRSTGRVVFASDDMLNVQVRIPHSYKNKNYVGSIFGGSMFSAVDPIPMIQLITILGDDYVVWDKSAEIFFKRPAREDLYADFIFTQDEIIDIRQRIISEKEIELDKITQLKGKDRSVVYCEIKKKIYVADKAFYKEKMNKRKQTA